MSLLCCAEVESPPRTLQVSDFCFDGEFGSPGATLEPGDQANHFVLTPGMSPTGGGKLWNNRIQFEIKSGAAGNTLSLEVRRNPATRHFFNQYFVSYSSDREHWQPVKWRHGTDGLEVDWLEFPRFSADRIYVGWQVPLSPQMLEARIARWQKHPHVRIHRIGQSLQYRPVYRIEIGTSSSRQTPVHYIANHHPGEGNAQWRILGMIEWLLGPEGTEARRNHRFHFTPLACPDGAANGWGRCGVEGIDMNRSYCPEGADISSQAHEVFLCQSDLEELMDSPCPLTTAWFMHTWDGLLEPFILPGPDVAARGGVEALAGMMASFDADGISKPLALYGEKKALKNAANFNNGPWIQFGITSLLVEGGSLLRTPAANLACGQMLVRGIDAFWSKKRS